MYSLKKDHDNNRYLVCVSDQTIKIFGYDPSKDATDARGQIGTAYRASVWIIDNDPAR